MSTSYYFWLPFEYESPALRTPQSALMSAVSDGLEGASGPCSLDNFITNTCALSGGESFNRL